MQREPENSGVITHAPTGFDQYLDDLIANLTFACRFMINVDRKPQVKGMFKGHQHV
jgi:hypothetical protein